MGIRASSAVAVALAERARVCGHICACACVRAPRWPSGWCRLFCIGICRLRMKIFIHYELVKVDGAQFKLYTTMPSRHPFLCPMSQRSNHRVPCFKHLYTCSSCCEIWACSPSRRANN